MHGSRTIIASLVVLLLVFSVVPIQNQLFTQLDYTQSADSSTLTLNEPPPPQNEPPTHEALLWNRTFGGTGYDYAEEIIECSDGGFAIIGSTQSFGAGGYDAWLIRVDADGNDLWSHTYGYSGNDYGYGIVECSGGGFAITGELANDMMLLRTDALGNHLWNKSIDSGYFGDEGHELVECTGGGFAIAGLADDNFWLVRTDSSGNPLWNTSLYGAAYGGQCGLVECADQGFAVCGTTDSYGASSQYTDIILIRYNSSGAIEWFYTYHEHDRDTGADLIERPGGGFALVGSQGYSTHDRLWILFVGADGSRGGEQIHSTWRDCFGYSIFLKDDGGYAITGNLGVDDYLEQFWCLNTGSNGRGGGINFGGYWDADVGKSIIEVGSSNGFALTGYTDCYGAGSRDIWVVRVAPIYFITEPQDFTVEYSHQCQRYYYMGAFYGYDQVWTSDPTHFTTSLDSPWGVSFSSISSLAIGTYPLTVYVNDSMNNIVSRSITISVEDTEGPMIDLQGSSMVDLEVGDTFQREVTATDPSGVDSWTINDTTAFSLTVNSLGQSSSATIESTGTLAEGEYFLEISVFDPYNNNNTRIFFITVEQPYSPPPDGIPGFPFEALLIGLSLTLGLLIFIRRKAQKPE